MLTSNKSEIEQKNEQDNNTINSNKPQEFKFINFFDLDPNSFKILNPYNLDKALKAIEDIT